MSYAYRIKLESLTSTVEQKGQWQVNLMDILPLSEMQALLRSALLNLGWSEEDGTIVTEIDGIRCALSEEKMTVEAKISEEVFAEHTVVGDSDDSQTLRAARLEQGHEEHIKKLEKQESHVNRLLTQQLLMIEPKLKEVLDRATHEVHAQALKLKASRLGEVQSIKESTGEDGELEITIHVKVH